MNLDQLFDLSKCKVRSKTQTSIEILDEMTSSKVVIWKLSIMVDLPPH